MEVLISLSFEGTLWEKALMRVLLAQGLAWTLCKPSELPQIWNSALLGLINLDFWRRSPQQFRVLEMLLERHKFLGFGIE